MLDVLAVLAIPSLAGGGIAGFATYELFSRIMPRDVGVPLGCVFGTLVGLGVAGLIFGKMSNGVEMP